MLLENLKYTSDYTLKPEAITIAEKEMINKSASFVVRSQLKVIDFDRYSDYIRLLKVTCCILKLLYRKTCMSNDEYNFSHIKRAENCLFRLFKMFSFSKKNIIYYLMVLNCQKHLVLVNLILF